MNNLFTTFLFMNRVGKHEKLNTKQNMSAKNIYYGTKEFFFYLILCTKSLFSLQCESGHRKSVQVQATAAGR